MQNKNKDLFKLSAPGIVLLAAFSGLDNKAQARDFSILIHKLIEW